jgi:hypothetical protein
LRLCDTFCKVQKDCQKSVSISNEQWFRYSSAFHLTCKVSRYASYDSFIPSVSIMIVTALGCVFTSALVIPATPPPYALGHVQLLTCAALNQVRPCGLCERMFLSLSHGLLVGISLPGRAHSPSRGSRNAAARPALIAGFAAPLGFWIWVPCLRASARVAQSLPCAP